MSGLNTYDAGPKKEWRRQITSEIRRRVPKPWNANVLYLPGEHDCDRKLLVQKGFNPSRLFGVEFSPKTHAVLRSAKKPVILGDLADVMRGWPPDFHIDVVYADFTGNVQSSSIRDVLTCCFFNPAVVPNAVIAINCARGRESDIYAEFCTRSNDFFRDKNRAKALFLLACWNILEAGGNGHDLDAVMDRAQRAFKPKFFAPYRSNRTTMDSMVFTCGYKRDLFTGANVADERRIAKVKKSIYATRATLTKRLSGALPEAPRS